MILVSDTNSKFSDCFKPPRHNISCMFPIKQISLDVSHASSEYTIYSAVRNSKTIDDHHQYFIGY